MLDPVDPSSNPRPLDAQLGAERERTIARLPDARVLDREALEKAPDTNRLGAP